MVFEGKIKTEIILHHKHVSTEKHFRKMHFPCATKHPHLWRRAILASGFAGEVKGCDSKSKSNGDPGLWVRRRSQWVQFEVEALGSWHEVSGSPAKSKLVGRRQWPLSSSSLSLSLRAGAISLAHSLSLYLYFPENGI